jgi:hypothetical protein
MSSPASARSIQFVTLFGQTATHWHHPAARQFVIALDTTIEIENSDRQHRQLLLANVVLVENTWGEGHRPRLLVTTRGR